MLRMFILRCINLCALIGVTCVTFACGRLGSGLHKDSAKQRRIRSDDSNDPIMKAKSKSDDKKVSPSLNKDLGVVNTKDSGGVVNTNTEDSGAGQEVAQNSPVVLQIDTPPAIIPPAITPEGKAMIENLSKIKSNIESPEAMEAIGQAIKPKSWNFNFYEPEQNRGWVNEIEKPSAKEIAADPNFKARQQNGKVITAFYMNDRAPDVFGERDTFTAAGTGESAVDSELYSTRDSETQTVSLYGFMKITIVRNTQEFIILRFGDTTPTWAKDGEAFYDPSKDVVLDESNTPQSGILTVTCEVHNKGKTTKTYDLGNLKGAEKENIKKLGLFNIKE